MRSVATIGVGAVAAIFLSSATVAADSRAQGTVTAAALPGALSADASGSRAFEARCQALASVDFEDVPDAPTQLIRTDWIEPKDGAPAFCRVTGYVVPQVAIELRLPATHWNGKFMQVGCGGPCGQLNFASGCDQALSKGYACLTSDMGHTGSGDDALWASGNLQAKVDWGYRATHVAALAGKAVTARYYEQSLRKSYFIGCSTGGRQGLQEAQRFPWDFDGIIAGAPPIDLGKLYMDFAWGQRANHDTSGNPLLKPEHLQLLTSAAVAQCDIDDGLKDGVIEDPLRCSFDPATLAGQGLTRPQIDAARRIYAGIPTMHGNALRPAASLPGSESGSWNLYFGAEDEASVVERIVLSGFRYFLFSPEPGATWTLKDLDFERDYKRLGVMQMLVDSSNPDLRTFKGAGGKLLVYQGWNDGPFPRSTIDYYETVERTMGGRKRTQDFMRLFLLPGVNHCSGGEGADAVDLLGHLEAWVEDGKAPDRIVAGHFKDPQPVAYPYRPFPADASQLRFTRPLFPYPLRAKYRGSGDPNDASNFNPSER